ncbi:MAG TPA: metallophosphoesterase [Symbiobacteriaceae bacterium]|nr:metallophosphoesterase [Symbiobacteriaceae bacterium]
MRNRFLFGLIALTLFSSMNYYVGLRVWQWLQAAAPGGISSWGYWFPFWLISCAYLVARFAGHRVPRPVEEWLARVGAYWMMVFMYILPLLVGVDVVRGVAGLAGFSPLLGQQGVAIFGGAILAVLIVAVRYGAWRARNPVINRYEITVNKSGGKHKDLHVVLVSDTHLGAINGPHRMQAMIAMVGELEPDLLLLCGDIVDDDFRPDSPLNAPVGLKQLKAKLGTYAVLGNHEYHSGHVLEYRRQMAKAGIPVLVDEWVKVDDSLYVIGRDDIAGRSETGRSRKDLDSLMEGIDRSLPLVLMDHQPYRLEEAEQAGIDLQVSGHTHRGQIFPNHLITRRVFELDWGYLQKGALHVVVSLGFGTWGPPVRIGNRPEVVSIRVRFAGER